MSRIEKINSLSALFEAYSGSNVLISYADAKKMRKDMLHMVETCKGLYSEVALSSMIIRFSSGGSLQFRSKTKTSGLLPDLIVFDKEVT